MREMYLNESRATTFRNNNAGAREKIFSVCQCVKIRLLTVYFTFRCRFIANSHSIADLSTTDGSRSCTWPNRAKLSPFSTDISRFRTPIFSSFDGENKIPYTAVRKFPIN